MTEWKFGEKIPALNDRCMGPLFFEPYAKLVGERCVALKPEKILETAAGTGIVTRAMHRAVPRAQIVATDITPAMLEFATQALKSENVSYQHADAQNLPFPDASFDVVVCQFGVMFFPDKVRAHSEARRVLRGKGRYLMLAFNRVDANPVPKAAIGAVNALFDLPFDYMERGPFSYSDTSRIKADLLAAGFTDVKIETIERSSRVNASEAAQGLIYGSPLRAEIERRDPAALERAAAAVVQALQRWDGKEAPMSAHLATSGSVAR